MAAKNSQQQFASLLALSEFALAARREKLRRANRNLSEHDLDALYRASLVQLPSHRDCEWFRERRLVEK